MLIAIDHGNKSVKLPRGDPFVSGLVESEVAPFGKDVLKYRGRYYQLSDHRIPYHRDKTEDERFFVLTLFAIAREINATGRYTAGTIQVQLAVGLPPAHFGAQHQPFTSYFLGRGPVSFVFHQRPYSILINDVACFPQSYAAAVTILPTLQNEPRALVLDIGGFTADYLQLRNGEGNLKLKKVPFPQVRSATTSLMEGRRLSATSWQMTGGVNTWPFSISFFFSL